MNLNISNAEWSVLFRQLCNGKINSFKAHEIIEEHKKILNDFKEKLKLKKEKQIEKYRKELEEKYRKDMGNKILKFESEQEEKLQEKFKNEFFKITQNIGGMR